jgi:hypothetical protein
MPLSHTELAAALKPLLGNDVEIIADGLSPVPDSVVALFPDGFGWRVVDGPDHFTATVMESPFRGSAGDEVPPAKVHASTLAQLVSAIRAAVEPARERFAARTAVAAARCREPVTLPPVTRSGWYCGSTPSGRAAWVWVAWRDGLVTTSRHTYDRDAEEALAALGERAYERERQLEADAIHGLRREHAEA